MIKVIGMFPNIEGKKRNASLLHAGAGSLSVGAVPDLKLAVLINEPCPTTAKVSNSRVGELFLTSNNLGFVQD